MKNNNLIIITLGITALFLAACDSPSPQPDEGLMKTANIIKENDYQLAIMLTERGEWAVVDIPSGTEFTSCALRTKEYDETAGLPVCPPKDGKEEVQYKERILFEVVTRNPTCARITIGSFRFEECSPPHPLKYIQALMPH